jgi:hypothetical protein
MKADIQLQHRRMAESSPGSDMSCTNFGNRGGGAYAGLAMAFRLGAVSGKLR